MVNSTEGPPEFKKPDFRLSHLIESGNFLVGEQKRVENSHLVDDYNRLNRGRNSAYLHHLLRHQLISRQVMVQLKAKTNGNGFQKQEGLSSHLTLDTQAQIRQLLSQGYKISIEHVDERRFRTGSWQTCVHSHIDAESDAISNLEATLAEYSGEYVRLVGIDPKAKRRVVETIIQRPDGKN